MCWTSSYVTTSNATESSIQHAQAKVTQKQSCYVRLVGQKRDKEALSECGVATLNHTQARNRESGGGVIRKPEHKEEQK